MLRMGYQVGYDSFFNNMPQRCTSENRGHNRLPLHHGATNVDWQTLQFAPTTRAWSFPRTIKLG